MKIIAIDPWMNNMWIVLLEKKGKKINILQKTDLKLSNLKDKKKKYEHILNEVDNYIKKNKNIAKIIIEDCYMRFNVKTAIVLSELIGFINWLSLIRLWDTVEKIYPNHWKKTFWIVWMKKDFNIKIAEVRSWIEIESEHLADAYLLWSHYLLTNV